MTTEKVVTPTNVTPNDCIKLLSGFPSIKVIFNGDGTSYGESSQSHPLRYSPCNLYDGYAIELIKPVLCRDILTQYAWENAFIKKIKEVTLPYFNTKLNDSSIEKLVPFFASGTRPKEFYNSEQLVMTLTFAHGDNWGRYCNIKDFLNNLYLLHSLEDTLGIYKTEIFSVIKISNPGDNGGDKVSGMKILVKADPIWDTSHFLHGVYSFIVRGLLCEADKDNPPTHIVDHLLYCRYLCSRGYGNKTGSLAAYIFDNILRDKSGIYQSTDYPSNLEFKEIKAVRYVFDHLLEISKDNPLTGRDDNILLTARSNFTIIEGKLTNFASSLIVDRNTRIQGRTEPYSYGGTYLFSCMGYDTTRIDNSFGQIFRSFTDNIRRLYQEGLELNTEKQVVEKKPRKKRTTVRIKSILTPMDQVVWS